MKIFNLPDLGEGLPDAEISEWLVKEGDEITVDDPLVSMETAKAVVEVPSPYTGTIKKLHGKVGDIIKTGAPLVDFDGEQAAEVTIDKGTVVGNIESTGATIEETTTVGARAAQGKSQAAIKATPAVRALAKRLHVDLSLVTPSAANSVITAADVERVSSMLQQAGELELLRGARRTMANMMAKSHAEIVPVTIFDDADIYQWDKSTDITVRLIQAVVTACQQEPALNAWYDSQQMGKRVHQEVNLGLAIDTGDELLVPVIKQAGQLNEKQLREIINQYKQQASTREIAAEDLRGASIILSNFGNFAGRYATPIIVPPMVAILGVGKIRQQVAVEDGKPAVHKVIPLSLSFDHRAVTGGESTRFLGHVIASLQS